MPGCWSDHRPIASDVGRMAMQRGRTLAHGRKGGALVALVLLPAWDPSSLPASLVRAVIGAEPATSSLTGGRRVGRNQKGATLVVQGRPCVPARWCLRWGRSGLSTSTWEPTMLDISTSWHAGNPYSLKIQAPDRAFLPTAGALRSSLIAALGVAAVQARGTRGERRSAVQARGTRGSGGLFFLLVAAPVAPGRSRAAAPWRGLLVGSPLRRRAPWRRSPGLVGPFARAPGRAKKCCTYAGARRRL